VWLVLGCQQVGREKWWLGLVLVQRSGCYGGGGWLGSAVSLGRSRAYEQGKKKRVDREGKKVRNK